MKSTISVFVLSILSFTSIWATDYVVVAKESNVFDEANAKYATLNQNNDEISVLPGMVFPTSQHTPGWYKIEYSPGLHAFIPDQITASNFKVPVAGTYKIQNNPGKNLIIVEAGDNWSAITDGKNYKGIKFENILIFVDDNQNAAFSLVDMGNGPIVFSYDNNITKFF